MLDEMFTNLLMALRGLAGILCITGFNSRKRITTSGDIDCLGDISLLLTFFVLYIAIGGNSTSVTCVAFEIKVVFMSPSLGSRAGSQSCYTFPTPHRLFCPVVACFGYRCE